MKHFDELYAIACGRKGEEALEARLPTVASPAELRSIGDDRYLSAMTQVVFSAGFVWRVIRNKWPGFEEAFEGFEPGRVAARGELDPTSLFEDTRIVRNPQKIRATFDNAHFVLEIIGEHGSFGDFVAEWPEDDTVGLWSVLKKRGSRLGGDSGPRFLRMMGRDTFILTQDVTQALTQMGVLTAKPTSQKQQKMAQEAFSTWRQQSGRSLGAISVVLACTV